MSRLAELIEELCPDGVEYKPLGELLVYQQPTPFLVSSKDYDPSYPTPVLTAGATFLLGYSSETHGVYAASTDDPVIIFDDFTTASKWVDFPFKLKSSAAKILTAADPSVADIRFLYFLMQTIKYQVGSHARHWIAVYSKMPVCCPPLNVQREIVRILDQFTTLEAELEAELEARRTQYEHYRNHLLSMTALKQRCGEIAVRKLGEVGVFHGGLTGKTKADFVDSPDASAFVTYKEIYSRIEIDSIPVGRVQVADKEKQLALQYGDVLFTGSSENSEEVGMTAVVTSEFSERVYLNSFSICFRWSEELFDPGYAKHMFNSPEIRREIQRCASGVTRFNLSKKRMEKISVPVPPLEVQHEIMRVLDDFDALVNDISSGLPAEIAARRAQYEHYRDRLLSFPEKKAE